MKKVLMLLTAMSVFLVGCGNDETPKMKQAEESKAMQETPAPMTEKTEPAAPQAETAPTAEAPAASEAAPVEGMPAAEGSAAATTSEATPATAGEEQAGMTMAPTDSGKGKQVYDSVCFACHAMGVAGAPKFGDKAAWAPRIAQGMDILVSHATNGFQGKSGVMPPKGGRPDLSDADITAAITYMVDNAK